MILEEGLFGKLGALGMAGVLGLSTPAFGKTAAPVTPVMKHATKGIRNNNPGNIRKGKIKWNGVVGNDGQFLKFATPEDGIRALSRLLRVYVLKHHLDTPEKIMHRWAPPKENPTKNYVGFVAQKLGKKPTDKVDLKNQNEFAKLVAAIIEFETGSEPYDSATILRGINKP